MLENTRKKMFRASRPYVLSGGLVRQTQEWVVVYAHLETSYDELKVNLTELTDQLVTGLQLGFGGSSSISRHRAMHSL